MITLKLTDANLDNENYRLHFSWNSTGFWTMDIRDSENADLVRGIKLVPNFPLLNQYRRISNKLPRGEFLIAVVNQSVEKNQTISREGFSSGEFTLIYVPQEELKNVLEAEISN